MQRHSIPVSAQVSSGLRFTKRTIGAQSVGKLIMIRHGHTPLNSHGKEERLRSWLDVPLDEQGMQEAVETSQKLAHYPVTAIFSSDLKRARQTAEKIRQTTNAKVFETNELRPWNLGVFGGRLLREIIPFLNLLNEHPEMPAPNGESFHQFYERYSHRLYEMLERAEESTGYVVAVTHVRNLLAAKVILEHGDRDRVPVQGGPTTGTITIVEKHNGTWKMRPAHDPFIPIPLTQPESIEVAHAVPVV
jgi:broad specificity phosphatase PhoE